MKKNLHPERVECTITCACGNVIETASTKENVILLTMKIWRKQLKKTEMLINSRKNIILTKSKILVFLCR